MRDPGLSESSKTDHPRSKPSHTHKSSIPDHPEGSERRGSGRNLRLGSKG